MTTRNWKGKNPLRIVFDRELKLKPSFNIFNNEAETIIIADVNVNDQNFKTLNSKIGIEFVDYSSDFYTQLFNVLVKRNIQSVIIEGGELVLNSFINENLWDEARIFYGNMEFVEGVKAPKLLVKTNYFESIGDSKLVLIKNN